MKMSMIVFILYLLANLGISAADINYDEVGFENSKGEVFISKNEGVTWQKLRMTKNPYKEQVYISKTGEFVSDNKGKDWTEVVNEVENQKVSSIQIFPNPVNGSKISLKFESDIQGTCKVSIFCLNGEKQVSYEIENYQNSNLVELNIPKLQKGTYIVLIKNNGKTYYSKFITK